MYDNLFNKLQLDEEINEESPTALQGQGIQTQRQTTAQQNEGGEGASR